MDFRITQIGLQDFPIGLTQIPNIPDTLYIVGAQLPKDGLYLSIVSSPDCSPYALEVCERLITGLVGTPLILVSDLSLGLASTVHHAALKAKIPTVAILGSGLSENVLYPKSNLNLAKAILLHGGTLVSEHPAAHTITVESVAAADRLVAGIAKAVLVIETVDESPVVRLALEYNREVFSVPGPITSALSREANLQIKNGSTVITTSADIKDALGLLKVEINEEEKIILELLTDPIPRTELTELLEGTPYEIAVLLGSMEVKGLIKEEDGNLQKI